MKSKSLIVPLGLALIFAVQSFAQTTEEKQKTIAGQLNESCGEAVCNFIDTCLLKKGFQQSFALQGVQKDRAIVTGLDPWNAFLESRKELGTDRGRRLTTDIQMIGIEENEWRATNGISGRKQISQEAKYKRILEWEKRVNKELQPPEKVMDAIGVKPGMTIGEVGVGYGRYTVHLARRVGDKGRIYANDIDDNALSFLRDRCQRENITNVEIILGEEENPLFPERSLDMAFMVWVFHGLDKPGPLFENLKSSLKPGAPLVIVDPIDSEIDMEREHAGEKIDPDRPTIRERVEKAAEEAGFEIVRTETLLPKDYIFVLQVKTDRQGGFVI